MRYRMPTQEDSRCHMLLPCNPPDTAIRLPGPGPKRCSGRAALAGSSNHQPAANASSSIVSVRAFPPTTGFKVTRSTL